MSVCLSFVYVIVLLLLKVRLSSTPCLNCADLLHVGSGTYQVLMPGSLNCLTSGGENHLLTLNASSSVFQLSPYLGCYNTHLSFGDCKLKVCMLIVCVYTGVLHVFVIPFILIIRYSPLYPFFKVCGYSVFFTFSPPPLVSPPFLDL